MHHWLLQRTGSLCLKTQFHIYWVIRCTETIHLSTSLGVSSPGQTWIRQPANQSRQPQWGCFDRLPLLTMTARFSNSTCAQKLCPEEPVIPWWTELEPTIIVSPFSLIVSTLSLLSFGWDCCTHKWTRHSTCCKLWVYSQSFWNIPQTLLFSYIAHLWTVRPPIFIELSTNAMLYKSFCGRYKCGWCNSQRTLQGFFHIKLLNRRWRSTCKM